MDSVRAVWTNGRIVPTEPVDWPEGSELLVEPVCGAERIGLDESQWEDSPAALADWEKWIQTIEPLEFTDDERQDLKRFQEELRLYNLAAVRKQMGLEKDK